MHLRNLRYHFSRSVRCSSSAAVRASLSLPPPPIYKPPTWQSWNALPHVLWQDSLARFLPSSPGAKLDPSLAPYIYYADQHVTFMYDRYPKSSFHLLAMPTSGSPPDLSSLVARDVPWLRLVEAMSRHFFDAWASRLSDSRVARGSPLRQLWVGFHALPSLRPLHAHILSADMSSPHMKSKAHYLSYTTPFFRPLPLMLGRLERGATPSPTDDNEREYYEELTRGPLISHLTGEDFLGKLQRLKAHLEQEAFGGGPPLLGPGGYDEGPYFRR